MYSPIRIETVSSTETGYIVYDYNNVFAKIRLSDQPEICTLTASFPSLLGAKT